MQHDIVAILLANPNLYLS